MAVADSGYLTKHELVELLGIKEAQLRQWRRDGVLPAEWTIEHGLDTHETAYRTDVLALGELLLELRQTFGSNSPLPNEIAVELRPRLATLWRHACEGEMPTVTLRYETRLGLKFEIPLTFMNRARMKLARVAG